MTVQAPKSAFSKIQHQLKDHYPSREAQNLAFWLMEHFYQLDRAAVVLNTPFHPTDEAIQQVDKAIGRLSNKEPIQYVLGETYFLGKKFKTDTRALIPRTETEELVQLVIHENRLSNLRIVDIGTGSGCIAISLSLGMESPKVFATDFSREALELARENARFHQSNVDFLHHDILLEPLPVDTLDIMVSNPPYIPVKDKSNMHSNVLDYEPGSALFVPDDEPLLFYEKIARIASEKLVHNGKLYFEIHESFGSDVHVLLTELGFENIAIIQDMQGKDRIAQAKKA